MRHLCIPGTYTLKPMGRLDVGNPLPVAKVSDLIDQETCLWKVSMIRDNFLPPDAEAILNIPLRRNGDVDYYAWNFERTGIYIVKSAYRALVTQKERSSLEEGTAMGTPAADEQLWKSL
jgi:hypothetical protein